MQGVRPFWSRAREQGAVSSIFGSSAIIITMIIRVIIFPGILSPLALNRILIVQLVYGLEHRHYLRHRARGKEKEEMNRKAGTDEKKVGTPISNLTYPTSGSMVKRGITTRKIGELRQSGQLVRIKRGLYRVRGLPLVDNQDFVDVAQAVPDGVICLTSALAYHDLTTFNPSFVTVALRKGSRIPVVEYPPVDFYLFGDKVFELGVERIREGEFAFRIYDREKTVCDCMRYRNKIGIDIAKEGLREYLKRKDRNLSKLSRYAEICRVKTIMNNWLDALV